MPRIKTTKIWRRICRTSALCATLLIGSFYPYNESSAATMDVGTNFWFLAPQWSGENPWKWSKATDNSNDPESYVPDQPYTNRINPWSSQFLAETAHYSLFRFMDWGKTNSSTLKTWNQRTLPDNKDNFGPATVGASNGPLPSLAYEWMIDLCNRQDADMWICIPHEADDNFVTQLAKLIHDNLEPQLKVYVEYSNEIWNFTVQQSYCKAQGVKLGFTDDFKGTMKYQAYRSAEVWNLFENAFSGETDRVINVISGQSTNTGICNTHLTALFDPGFNPTGSLPESYAIAPYFGGNGLDGVDSDVWNKLREDIFTQRPAGSTGAGGSSRIDNVIAHYNKAVTEFGIELIAYEGGQHVQTNALDINRDPKMYALYIDYLDALAPYLSLFTHYVHAGKFNESDCWGAKEYTGQPASEAHKFRAIYDWIEANSAALSPPAVPSGLIASTGSASGTINLNWEDVSNESNYRLECREASGSWSLVSGNIASNTTSFTDSDLTPEGLYEYRLRAENADGFSNWTVEQSASAGTDGSSGGELILTVNGSDVVLDWPDYTGNGNFTNYRIFRDDTAGALDWWETVSNYTDAGVANGTYSYEVIAWDNNSKIELQSWTNSITVGGTYVPNVAPVANAGTDQIVTDSDNSGSESVTLKGSGSSDSDGSISSYAWSWSGGSATGLSPSASFPVGSTTVTLTVTDDDGATNTDTVTITVNAGGTGGGGTGGGDALDVTVQIDPWIQYDGFVFRAQNDSVSASITQIQFTIKGGKFDAFGSNSDFTIAEAAAIGNSSDGNIKNAIATLNFTGSGLATGSSTSVGSSGNYDLGDIDGNFSSIDVIVSFSDGTILSGTLADIGDSDDGDARLYSSNLVAVGTTHDAAGPNITIEAEDADNLGQSSFSPWEVLGTNPTYIAWDNGGSFAWDSNPEDNGPGVADYTFTLGSEAAVLDLYINVQFDTASDNSIYVKLVGVDSAWATVTKTGLVGFTWINAGNWSNLPAGDYTLKIHVREANTEVDRIFITTDGSNP